MISLISPKSVTFVKFVKHVWNSLQCCWWQARRIRRRIVACWFMKPRFLIRPDLSKHPQLMCRGTGGTEDDRICWCLWCLQGSMLKNRITISISRISVSVMSLPCLAWLISVSICLGGISTELDGNSHDDNSRLLQITPVPLESSNCFPWRSGKVHGIWPEWSRCNIFHWLIWLALSLSRCKFQFSVQCHCSEQIWADRSYMRCSERWRVVGESCGGMIPTIRSGLRWCRMNTVPQPCFAVGQPDHICQRWNFVTVLCPWPVEEHAQKNITFTWRMHLGKKWAAWWHCKSQICSISNSRRWHVFEIFLHWWSCTTTWMARTWRCV